MVGMIGSLEQLVEDLSDYITDISEYHYSCLCHHDADRTVAVRLYQKFHFQLDGVSEAKMLLCEIDKFHNGCASPNIPPYQWVGNQVEAIHKAFLEFKDKL